MKSDKKRYITLANRILIPKKAQAILWDMDGVLIDSLGFDYVVCNELVQNHLGEEIHLPDAFIQSIFAYHPPEFWKRISAYIEKNFKISVNDDQLEIILQAYETQRQARAFDVNPGIEDILQAAKKKGLKLAVVSNNPTTDVIELLERSKIDHYFDKIIGNDLKNLKKKPAPDTYLFAAKKLGVKQKRCVVIEDSSIGIEAGSRAKCHTIAVAMGGEKHDLLSKSPYTNQAYKNFDTFQTQLRFGNVLDKKIDTPNDFVSHMVEHIAWRLGTGINLSWNNDNWVELGKELGSTLRKIPHKKKFSATLGMIDDGSAEVSINMSTKKAGVTFKEVPAIDLKWFLNLRCEQLHSGQPLVALLQGLAQALNAHFKITICSAEDPHHTWEGIFRSIGIALAGLNFTPEQTDSPPSIDTKNTPPKKDLGSIIISEKRTDYCQLLRKTAESEISLTVDFNRTTENHFIFEVADSIKVDNFAILLEALAKEAGFSLQVTFKALALSSSHVVLEDTAMVLGRALLEILKERMENEGANCAGSSFQTLKELNSQKIRLGISVEGRKFCRFAPLSNTFAYLREHFLIGKTILDHIRAEDLDDFLDGFAGGMLCSLMIHFEKVPVKNKAVEKGWIEIFSHMGVALKQVFEVNPNRRGVPAGVKATLL
ncbi:HAD-IA family hydrolase [Magnetococcales bacterium HHB-1]